MAERADPTCQTCQFWLVWESYAGAGHCRRHAPAVKPDGAAWPRTYVDDWCGDHVPHAPDTAMDTVTAYQMLAKPFDV